MNQEYCLWAEKRLLMAEKDSSIQGYSDGFFWERNSLLDQEKRKSREGCCFLCSSSMGQVWRIEIINSARFLVEEGATTSTPKSTKKELTQRQVPIV